MANYGQNYNKFSVYEPRMELNNERSFVIVKGGQTVTYTSYPATSYSNSNFNFTTNPPGKKNVLDRVVIIETPVELDFVGPGDASANRIIQEGRDAFRSYPISSITSTLTSTINGFPVSLELNQIVHTLSRFHTPMEDKNGFASLLPQMEDTYQNYSDADIGNNNPLSSYPSNSTQVPRGAYPMLVNPNTNTNATVTAILREYLILPPYLFDSSEAGGLTNLDTLEFNFVLSPNLARIWSRSTLNTVPLTSLTVNFGQPSILLGWITPRLTQNIPSLMSYPYFQISKYITNQPVGAIPAWAYPLPPTAVEIKSNVIQFNSIPRKLYFWAKQSDTIINASLAATVNTPDVFLPITRVNISWDNLDGVLSGASQENLYDISISNGMKIPFVEWNGVSQHIQIPVAQAATGLGLSGGPLCLELGKDLGLRDNQAEGALDKINFQLRLTVQNVNQLSAITPDLYIMAVYDGVLEIFDNSARAYIGVITPYDILNAPVNHEVTYKMLEKIYGGTFFEKFKDVAGKVIKGLKDTKAISNVLSAIPHPYAQVAAPIARQLGFGEGARAGVRAGVLIGGCQYCPQGRCMCGNGENEYVEKYDDMLGGKMADKRLMKKRLSSMRKR